MTGFGVDPAAVHRHAGDIGEYGDQVHDVVRALSTELAGIGDCWGDDEVGSAFAGQHVEPASDALSALRHAGDQLRDAGERFSATARDYARAEQDNADRLRRAN
jgi:uncharacterized protein YukE